MDIYNILQDKLTGKMCRGKRVHFSIIYFIAVMMITTGLGCKKILAIDPPANSITTNETFADSSDAAAALAGIYSKLINSGGSLNFGSGFLTVYIGSASDELVPFNQTAGDATDLYANTVRADNGLVDGYCWGQPYTYIYQANACIEGIISSKGLTQTTKDQFIGEAKFLRAFFYFYLVNFFDDVPYITSTVYATTAIASRTNKAEIYQHIIQDLQDARQLLKEDYSYSADERIRANKQAATALLARVYLYNRDWANAEIQASTLINNTALFYLNTNLDEVYYKNNPEAILQLQLNTDFQPFDATPEGFNFIPGDQTSYPFYYLSPQLLGGFEANDQRKIAWIDSTNYEGTVYYYPHKYKIGSPQYTPSVSPSEYYMVLRLAEQYLIRAEAMAEQNKLDEAISDLNILRERASLPDLPASLTQAEVINAIAQDRKIELFAEWGHRWFDLKRTGAMDSIMNVATPLKLGNSWSSYQQLYPIPQSQRQADPNLTQNPGYQ